MLKQGREGNFSELYLRKTIRQKESIIIIEVLIAFEPVKELVELEGYCVPRRIEPGEQGCRPRGMLQGAGSSE